MIRRFLAFAVAAALLAAPSLPAWASTATATLNVTATVNTSCTINTQTLAFGAYDPTASADQNGTATITFACVKGTAYSISADNGDNPSHASGTTRAMHLGASNFLSYELYTSAARTTVWNTTNVISGTSSGKASTTFTAYGEIPATQDATTGSYSDTVTMTISF